MAFSCKCAKTVTHYTCVLGVVSPSKEVSIYSTPLPLLTTPPLTENTPIGFLEVGESQPGVMGVSPQLTAIAASDFLVLIGIFFPSVTGTHIYINAVSLMLALSIYIYIVEILCFVWPGFLSASIDCNCCLGHHAPV